MKVLKYFLALMLFFGSPLVKAGHGDIIVDKDNSLGDELILPTKELEWNITPRLLTGVMYFKHITFAEDKLSNKPIAFGGLGLNINLDKWFLYGYGLDTAKATDHIFEPKRGALSESNSVFKRRDYALTVGREISDFFSDSKDWTLALFAGYRHGETELQSTNIRFNDSVNIITGISNPDSIILTSGKYTVKGPLIGIGLKIKPFKKSNSQLGLNVGYGRLEGEYSRSNAYPILKTSDSKVSSDSAKVNTWITAISWEGELTPKLSYSFVVDYYSYSMPASRENISFTLKESVGSLKAFLNYHFK
jgi:hypothetical protein